jgi:hypothetical protein
LWHCQHAALGFACAVFVSLQSQNKPMYREIAIGPSLQPQGPLIRPGSAWSC